MKIIGITLTITMTALLACGGTARKNLSPNLEKQPDLFASYKAYDHFVRGDLMEQAGDLDGASNEYRKALILDPSSEVIKRTLSEIYLQQRKFDEAALLRSEITDKTAEDYNFIGDCLRYTNEFESAASFYSRSLDLDSTQYLTRSYLAKILLYLGKDNEAERHYQALVDYSPDKVDALLELADYYIKVNELDKALDSYSRAARIDTLDIRPSVGMAAIYLVKQDTALANAIYDDIENKYWDDPMVLNGLVVSYFSIRNFEKAESTAARVAELLPEDLDVQRRYAIILYGNEKLTLAESLMTNLSQTGKADASIYYYLARIQQDDNKFVQAEGNFRKSLALADTASDTWINLALVVNEQKRYHDAIEIMRDAIAKVPDDSIAILFFTSIIHARNEKYDLARDGYLRLIQSNPDNNTFRFNLGASYERLGEFDDAEREFKKVIEKEPDNAMALNYLGYMYADRGIKLDEAKNLIERALEIDPENGAYLDSYAWVLYKLGKYEEALVQMKKALLTETEDPVVYDHQGDIYLALNENDLAKKSWSRALELKPDDEAIRSKLDKK